MVEARCGRSTIHGLGLIAQEFIPKGAVVWRYHAGFDVLVPEDEFETLSPTAQKQLLNYAVFDVVDREFVLGSDDDRFTNHSDDPTLRWGGDDLVAVRDIHPGEEITCDYRDMGWTQFFGGPPGLEPRCLRVDAAAPTG